MADISPLKTVTPLDRNLTAYLRTFNVTPNDSTDLTEVIRALRIGATGGTVAYHDLDGNAITTIALPAEFTLEVAMKRVLSTGTTATPLMGFV